jgi:hypothetical protein
MYRREGNTVILTITKDEFSTLNIGLGYTLAVAREKDADLWKRWLRLINALNDGNPRWTPYEVPK